MESQYIFYYKEKNGVEHISYLKNDFDNDEDKGVYGKIGSTEKLIEFIRHNCLEYTSVLFDGFESGRIIYILNSISDVIDFDITAHEECYFMYKKQVKKRGKHGLD